MYKANYQAEQAVNENIQNKKDIANLENRVRKFGII
jgi:hypothetical protein